MLTVEGDIVELIPPECYSAQLYDDDDEGLNGHRLSGEIVEGFSCDYQVNDVKVGIFTAAAAVIWKNRGEGHTESAVGEIMTRRQELCKCCIFYSSNACRGGAILRQKSEEVGDKNTYLVMKPQEGRNIYIQN